MPSVNLVSLVTAIKEHKKIEKEEMRTKEMMKEKNVISSIFKNKRMRKPKKYDV